MVGGESRHPNPPPAYPLNEDRDRQGRGKTEVAAAERDDAAIETADWVVGAGWLRYNAWIHTMEVHAVERTLIIFKPDAVQRGICGEILTRFEKKGLQLVGLKLMRIPTTLAETHYGPHKGKPFYDGLVKFMTSSPVIVLAFEGKDAITIARKLMGATFGSKAEPGTIRGDFGVSNSFNLVHGSDSAESAERELGLFFKPEELVSWTPTIQPWVYEFGKGQAE
jgi:nucleoside-diphosphate kinase